MTVRGRCRGLVAVAVLVVARTAAAQPAPAPDAAVGLAIPEPPPDAPKVTAVPSAREVMLGEQFYLFISVTHPTEMQVNLPASLPLGDAFDEVDRTDHEIRNPDGTYTHEFELALMAFDVGDLRIPSILVTYSLAGQVHEVASKPVSIRVISFIGSGEEKLRDIAPPVAVDRPDWTMLYIIGGVVLGLIVIALAILIARWMRAPRVAWRAGPSAIHIRLPPHEEALARLDKLEGSGALDDTEDLKPAYHELSEIMRDYVGRVFTFPALDLTTLEIRNELTARPGGDVVEQLMREWLEQCDLVKFAGAPSTPDEARRALYDARLQIERIRAHAGALEITIQASPQKAQPVRPREQARAK